MIFEIIPTKIFLEQLKDFDDKAKRIIKSKIELIKLNPYRYKRIHSKKFSKIFRIRLNVNNVEMRLIYVILETKIILVCFLRRDKGYKDLENYLKFIER